MATDRDNHWTETALWAKAVQYTSQALRAERDSWLHPFWSALALEFLLRAALANVSPTLLADMSTNDVTNLLYALGKTPTTSALRSIGTSDVLARCEKLHSGFTNEHKKFCAGFVGYRNDELHTGGTPFAALTSGAWMPRYYDACKALVTAMKRDLKDLFGEEEAAAAQKMIAALHDATAKQVRQIISARKTIWDERSEEEKETACEAAARVAVRNAGHVVDCPACECKALVAGEEISQQDPVVEGSNIAIRSTMIPTAFECTACGLKINGHSHLHASDLGDTYVSTVLWNVIDYYAQFDDGPEPDFNE
jgi:hypothetical protein